MDLPFIKTTLQIFFWKWWQRKGCSKRTPCKAAPFSLMLNVYNTEIPTSTKTDSMKNISWEHSKIALDLAWKRSIMKSSELLPRTYTLLKKHLICFLEVVWKSWKITRKTSLAKFLLSNLTCPIYHLQLCWKPTPLKILLLSIKRLFQILRKLSVVESSFSKVTGKNFVAVLVLLVYALVLLLVPKNSCSRIFEKFPFNQCYRLAVYRLQSYYNWTSNHISRKYLENSGKFTVTYRLINSASCVFEIPKFYE